MHRGFQIDFDLCVAEISTDAAVLSEIKLDQEMAQLIKDKGSDHDREDVDAEGFVTVARKHTILGKQQPQQQRQ